MKDPDQVEMPWRQESNYGSETVYHWADIKAFQASQAHGDGYHVIEQAYGAPLEFLTVGEPFEHHAGPVLTVFSGAVGKRKERTPPFVSGRGIGPKLGVPLIAFSDPSLAMRRDFNIAWYAGSVFQDVQRAVDELLRPLAVRLEGDLWLVGGSAGGYGALQAAHRLGRHCSVFVWNPQTDIANYSQTYSRRYAGIAFPQLTEKLSNANWRELFRKEARAHHRIVDLVREAIPARAPRRLLYLQSVNDRHMHVHCAPYLLAHSYHRHSPGIWTRSENQVAWLAESGIGHGPPRPEMIQRILKRLMADDDSSVLQRTLQLDESPTFPGRAPAKRPERLEAQRAKVSDLVECRIEGSSVVVAAESLPPGFGRIRWTAVVRNAQDLELSQSSGNTVPGTWEMSSLEGAHHVSITLIDGFGAEIFHRELPIAA